MNTNVNADPREMIAHAPMTVMQVVIVALTIGLNALDGFDVLSISFASPGIAAEWGIDRAALGFVLSAELVGMAIGSILLGGVADSIGRRPTMLGCVTAMAIGMFMVTTAKDLVTLSAWRVLTGLGIGGLLAAINACVAEFSNARRKHLSVSLMSIGYPIGGVVGGMFVAVLLRNYDWRSVFYFGCAVTIVFIPLVYFLIPESVHWLARKQPVGALERINRTLKRIGHSTVASLPVISDADRKRTVIDIFAPGLIATTLIVTAAYFLHITTFYYILKWVPDIVVRMGFEPSSAAGVLNWYMAGGATGGAVFGLLTMRYSLKGLTIATFVLSTVMVSIFGIVPGELDSLSTICFFAGFMTNAAIVGMYAIFAHAYPTHVRATGTGFAIGVGRGGSVLAPIIAGFLFNGGLERPTVSVIMALGSLFAAGALLFLKLGSEKASAK
ncbi:MAG TPA: MFS transporter [Gammaproteobacteria bacterium]